MAGCVRSLVVLAAAAVAVVERGETIASASDTQKCGWWTPRVPMTRIVGGELVSAGEVPFMVSVQDNRWNSERHFCGGAIYDHNTIITAAHCVAAMSADILQIVSGEHDRGVDESSEQKSGVSSIIVHPQYDPPTYHNDIALLKLSQELSFSNHVQPISLPASGVIASGECMVTGWGALEENGDEVNLLYKITIPILPDSHCRTMYSEEEVFDSMVCAGYEEGGKDSCHGDSGSPLTCYSGSSPYLAGVVSWGYGCARPYCPSVYTEMSHFSSWVHQSSSYSYNDTMTTL